MLKSQEGDIVYVVCRKHKDLDKREIRGYDVISIHQTQRCAEKARDELRASPFYLDYRFWWNSYFLKV